jgi:hypothetical protein
MALILDGTNGLSDVDGSAATPAIRGSDANTGIFFPAADTIAFAEGGVEAMRIDSSGNLLVGTTSTDDTVTGFRYSSNRINITNAGLCGYINRQGSNGSLLSFGRSNVDVGSISVTTTNTAYNTSSDYRLKEAITPMTGALAKVALLKPCTYKWKVDGSDGQGFIAHELAEVEPGCVTGEKDAVDADGNPQYQGIDTSFLVATLTAAIQEQQAIITALTARVEALEGAQA